MTIEELTDRFYEDLNGKIVSIECVDENLQLGMTCIDWDDLDRTRRFELNFQDVKESTVRAGEIDSIQISSDHPLLWRHNREHRSIFFSSAPERPFELIGRLWEAHREVLRDWLPMSDFVCANSEILRAGYGRLADGPEPLIDRYVGAIDGLVTFSVIHARHSQNLACRVALLGEQYLVFTGCVTVLEEPLRVT